MVLSLRCHRIFDEAILTTKTSRPIKLKIMKIKVFFFLFCSVFFISGLYAQWNVVQETQRLMSFGSRPCFRMEFSGTDTKVIEGVWRDFAKKNYNAKLKKKKGEWYATKVQSSFMGSNEFSIYSTVESEGSKNSLNVWVDAGAYFLSSRDNSSRAEEMMRSLRQCYYDIRRAAIQDDLDDEEKKLKDLENKQKKLVRENESLHKDIENWKSRIQKAEQDLVNNVQDQETNLVDQDAQKRIIEEVKQRLNNVENETGN